MQPGHSTGFFVLGDLGRIRVGGPPLRVNSSPSGPTKSVTGRSDCFWRIFFAKNICLESWCLRGINCISSATTLSERCWSWPFLRRVLEVKNYSLTSLTIFEDHSLTSLETLIGFLIYSYVFHFHALRKYGIVYTLRSAPVAANRQVKNQIKVLEERPVLPSLILISLREI